MKISIITVNFNNKIGLENTIKSVIEQEIKDYEYIVIDGGSTDGSVDIIKKYKKYITYWISEKDNGIYNAMNKGIKQAKGEYCNFLNSGDVYYSKDTIKMFLDLKSVEDICIGNAYFINQAGKHIGTWYSPNTYTMKNIIQINPNHQSAFIKMTLMKDNLYDENFKIAADMDFFIKALIKLNCTYLKLNFTIVKYEGGGISAAQTSRLEKEKQEIYKKYLPERILADYLEYKEKRKKNTLYKNISYLESHILLSKLASYALFIFTIPIRFSNKFFKEKTLS